MIDFSQLSPSERLDLIGAIWESLDGETLTVTPAQKAEIKRRLSTLDEDIDHGEDAEHVREALRLRHG